MGNGNDPPASIPYLEISDEKHDFTKPNYNDDSVTRRYAFTEALEAHYPTFMSSELFGTTM